MIIYEGHGRQPYLEYSLSGTLRRGVPTPADDLEGESITSGAGRPYSDPLGCGKIGPTPEQRLGQVRRSATPTTSRARLHSEFRTKLDSAETWGSGPGGADVGRTA